MVQQILSRPRTVMPKKEKASELALGPTVSHRRSSCGEGDRPRALEVVGWRGANSAAGPAFCPRPIRLLASLVGARTLRTGLLALLLGGMYNQLFETQKDPILFHEQCESAFRDLIALLGTPGAVVSCSARPSEHLLLVASLILVVMPLATSNILATSRNALSY